MNRYTDEQRHAAYWSAIDRLRGSRTACIRANATMLVEVEDSMEHYRWCRRAPMSEIRGWAADILSAVEAMHGGAA